MVVMATVHVRFVVCSRLLSPCGAELDRPLILLVLTGEYTSDGTVPSLRSGIPADAKVDIFLTQGLLYNLYQQTPTSF